MTLNELALLCIICSYKELIDLVNKYDSFQLVLDHHSFSESQTKLLKHYQHIGLGGVSFKTCLDSDWPEQLRMVIPQPTILFYKGNWELINSPKKLGVVGARKITAYATTIMKGWLDAQISLTIPIVSGLAYGVDVLAHTQALSSNMPTIAVVANGLSDQVMYPKSHTSIAQQIVEKGGLLLSEYPFDQEAIPYQFPARNRIIAAISDVLWVVQAAAKSGSLITAELALELGKDVATLPAEVNNPYFEGNLKLLLSGAHLLDTSLALASLLNITPLITKPLFDHPIANSLQATNKDPQELSEILDLEITDVLIQLTTLEIEGVVKRVGEKWTLA
jgi:DNA processing protein